MGVHLTRETDEEQKKLIELFFKVTHSSGERTRGEKEGDRILFWCTFTREEELNFSETAENPIKYAPEACDSKCCLKEESLSHRMSGFE